MSCEILLGTDFHAPDGEIVCRGRCQLTGVLEPRYQLSYSGSSVPGMPPRALRVDDELRQMEEESDMPHSEIVSPGLYILDLSEYGDVIVATRA